MTITYDYTNAVLYAIDLIAGGATETRACDESNLPISTFKRFVMNVPELNELHTEAITRGADAMADALVEIDTHVRYGRSDPKMAKVISENIKWLLNKRQPKQYGNKVDVNISITADKAITQALLAGQQRALQPPGDDVIDVVPIEVVEEESIFD